VRRPSRFFGIEWRLCEHKLGMMGNDRMVAAMDFRELTGRHTISNSDNIGRPVGVVGVEAL